MRARVVLSAAAFSVVLAGCAAPAPVAPTPPLEVVNIHEAPGTKQQLCSYARDWAALTFKDSKAVIKVFDPEQGKMIGKGRFTTFAMLNFIPVDFTILVECREGRVRATYQSFMWNHGGSAVPLVDDALGLRGKSVEEVAKVDASLAAYLRNPKTGGNW